MPSIGSDHAGLGGDQGRFRGITRAALTQAACMHPAWLLLCLILSLPAPALAVEAAPAVSADGTEVLDPAAHLAWQRCVEGTQWNGKTCAGTPGLLSHAQALAAAAERRRVTGQAWRVPRVQDFERLARARLQAPVEVHLFPSAAPGWYWTSTARVDTRSVNPYDYANIRRGITDQNVNRVEFMHGWAVNDLTGETSGQFTKKTRLAVRLVRPLEP
jgi:hypothetical protein